MYMTLKRFSFLLVTFGFAAGMLSMGGVVKAQDSAPGTSGSGLRVSPTRSEIVLKAGESKEVTQTVRNVTQSPITVQPSLNDFESDGVTGQPKLVGDPDEVSINSLREFVTLPGDFDLQPDEEKELTVAVLVPVNASPGAYFGSVLYRAAPVGGQNDGQVALVASVGSLILLEVPGDITEQIEITDVSAYVDDSSGSLFTQKPNKIGVTISNLGNGFSRPFGKVSVSDWRGNNVFEYELNTVDRRSNVLPRSTRLFSQEFMDVEEKSVNGQVQQDKTSPVKWPGKYTITGNLSHGTTGEVFTVSSTFWYIPAWLIAILAVLLLVIIGSAHFMYRKHIKGGKPKRRRR